MVFHLLTFMVDFIINLISPTINMRGGSIIHYASGIPKNYSLSCLTCTWKPPYFFLVHSIFLFKSGFSN